MNGVYKINASKSRCFQRSITSSELTDDNWEFVTQNQACQSHISSEILKLTNALAGAPYSVAWVPSIYITDPNEGAAFAYVPGLVNFQVWTPPLDDYDDPLLWLPKPFGPRFNGGDVFEQEILSTLFVPNGVHFVDNWRLYHRDHGEIHCGTNVIRFPSEVERAYYEWWDYLP